MSSLKSLTLAVALAGAVGCTGSIGGGGPSSGTGDPDPSGNPVKPGEPTPSTGAPPGTPGGPPLTTADPNAAGPMPLRRLNRREYNNTVRDLLGDTSRPADAFPPDRESDFLFRRAGLVSAQDTDTIRDAAEALAAAAEKNVGTLAPCAAGARPRRTAARASSPPASACAPSAGRWTPPRCDRLVALYQSRPHHLGADLRRRDPLADRGHAAVAGLPLSLGGRRRRPHGRGRPGAAGRLRDRLAAVVLHLGLDARPGAVRGRRRQQAGHPGASSRRRPGACWATPGPATPCPPSSRSGWAWTRCTDRPKDPAVYPEFKDDLKAAMVAETRAFVSAVVFDGDGAWKPADRPTSPSSTSRWRRSTA